MVVVMVVVMAAAAVMVMVARNVLDCFSDELLGCVLLAVYSAEND